jgi:hypothetical protein
VSRTVEQVGRGHAIETRRFQSVLVLARTGLALTLLGFALGAILACLTAGAADQRLVVTHVRAKIAETLDPQALLGIQRTPVPAVIVPASPDYMAATRLLWRMGIAGGVLAVLLGTGLTVLLGRQWIITARDAALDLVLRGNRIATAGELTRLVMATRLQAPFLTIGTVPVPPQDEARHTLAIGKSGSGKTTFLHGHLAQIVARGEHGIVFDPDHSYTQHFYRPQRGDVLLDPFDARTARWDPLADIANLADAYRVAAVLLPKPANVSESSVWYDQARTLLGHILHHLADSGASLDALAAMLNTASTDDLRAIVASTPASRIFETGGERATASVLFMMTLAARTVDVLAAIPDTAPAFSFDRFYAGLPEHAGPKPLIFLATPRRFREAGAPVIAAWIDAAASAILQRPPGDAPKAWIILDELPSLPPVQSLLTLLPEGRKHGACCVLAFQSIAQMRERYGPEGAEIVCGQTATQLLMSVGDHASAKWAVDLIGTVEVENRRASEQLGDKEGGSLATSRERKSLVLDSELTGLAVGDAFLRLSGFPLARVAIDPGAPMPIIARDFVPAAAPPRIPVAATPSPLRIDDQDDWASLAGPF